MIGWFKQDPVKQLESKYAKLMEEAQKAQRNGDIEKFSELSFESETLLKEIDKIKAQNN